HTRLHGDVQGRLREAVVTDRVCRRAQSPHLRVRGRIVLGHARIAGACEHAVAHHYDRADRDLAARARRSGFANRLVHPAAIGVELWGRQGLVQDLRVAIGPAIATPRGSSYLGASLGAASPAGFAASFVPPVAPWLAASS